MRERKILNNRNGSALLTTIMVIGVMAILSVMTLDVMVADNKQSIYFVNKTQAYYLARSGADVVENALISQLSKYSDDVNAQKAFLDVYEAPQEIQVSIPGVKNVIVGIESNSGDRLLTVTSTAEYRGITQKVKKKIYSIVTEVASNQDGIIISGLPIRYIDSALQYPNNKNISSPVPANIAEQVSEDTFKPHIFPEISEAQWQSGNPYISNGVLQGTIGSPGHQTNIFVNGPLTIKGKTIAQGKVNIYVRNNLIFDNGGNVEVISESTNTDGINEYLFNIYVYNDDNNEYSLKTNKLAKTKFQGNLYIKQGKVDLDLHESTSIKGNIIYNGSDFTIGSQSNGFNCSFEGSIYAPTSTINMGSKNDKTAIDFLGIVLGRNIKIYANNNSQFNRFYSVLQVNGRVKIPVDTGNTITTRTVSYRSYYVD